VSLLPDPENTVAPSGPDERCVVVAGPGTSLTIPGIIVSEIVMALSESSRVQRIEVDLGIHPTMGLHRAPSLAAAHDVELRFNYQRHRAPRNGLARRKALHQWIGPDAKAAIAFAWPGIDNDWIRDFLQVAKRAGVPTIVLCASLPPSREVRAISMLSTMRGADRVVVGDTAEASQLIAAFGTYGPEVRTHRALSLTGRSRRSDPRRLTAFLPSDGTETLTALMGAFDAIPDAQISNYKLQVVTRCKRSAVESIVADSYHARHVQFIGDNMTGGDLRQLCDASSVLSLAEPEFDSRAFSTAVSCGIATIVLANPGTPMVGRGYVGGLMADRRQPASIHVALAHALRLDELRFPSPGAWRELARGVVGSPELASYLHPTLAPSYATSPRTVRLPGLVHSVQSTTETR
jgi:hypothetical protein